MSLALPLRLYLAFSLSSAGIAKLRRLREVSGYLAELWGIQTPVVRSAIFLLATLEILAAYSLVTSGSRRSFQLAAALFGASGLYRVVLMLLRGDADCACAGTVSGQPSIRGYQLGGIVGALGLSGLSLVAARKRRHG